MQTINFYQLYLSRGRECKEYEEARAEFDQLSKMLKLD